jgi:hypothetical protein
MAFSARNAHGRLLPRNEIFLCDDAECKVQVVLLFHLHAYGY